MQVLLSAEQIQQYIQLKRSNGPVIPVGGRLSTPEVNPTGSGGTVSAQQREEQKARLSADYAKQQQQYSNSNPQNTMSGIGGSNGQVSGLGGK